MDMCCGEIRLISHVKVGNDEPYFSDELLHFVILSTWKEIPLVASSIERTRNACKLFL
jgi:hypothetical protein